MALHEANAYRLSVLTKKKTMWKLLIFLKPIWAGEQSRCSGMQCNVQRRGCVTIFVENSTNGCLVKPSTCLACIIAIDCSFENLNG